jgi:hypothetical protein
MQLPEAVSGSRLDEAELPEGSVDKEPAAVFSPNTKRDLRGTISDQKQPWLRVKMCQVLMVSQSGCRSSNKKQRGYLETTRDDLSTHTFSLSLLSA